MNIGRSLLIGVVAVVLVWLLGRIVCRTAALVRWHRAKRPKLQRSLPALVLPMVLWCAPLLVLCQGLSRSMPVGEGELKTVRGSVVEYQTGSEKTSRYGPRRTYLAGLYLEGDSACYYLPGSGFDPEETLIQMGPEPVTVQYGVERTGARQIYTLTTARGEALLTYERSADILWSEAVLVLSCVGGVLLGGVGWALRLPPLWITGPEGIEKAATERKKAGGLLLCYYALLFGVFLLPRASEPPHPLYTTVELEGMAQVNLPGEWTQKAGETDTWYYSQKDAGLCIRLYDLGTPQEVGWTEEQWYEDVFASIRAFLLETFLEPGTEEFFETWEPVRLPSGLSGQITQGQGKSTGGALDAFVAAAFPETGCLVTFQVSSWSMEWEELEAYTQHTILPLVPYLEFTEQMADDPLDCSSFSGAGWDFFYYNTLRMRSTAWRVASASPKPVRRIYPSPLGPKPAPGVVTTLAWHSSRSKNSQEPIPLGVRAHT